MNIVFLLLRKYCSKTVEIYALIILSFSPSLLYYSKQLPVSIDVSVESQTCKL